MPRDLAVEHNRKDCIPIQRGDWYVCRNCGWGYGVMDTPFRRNCPSASDLPETPGVGTELKHLLRTFRIVTSTGCGCEEKARMMDENGPDWCEENLETIVDWLHEGAKRRKLPFVRTGARLLVRYAIRRARKKLAMLEVSGG
jgi:hypothetical protein